MPEEVKISFSQRFTPCWTAQVDQRCSVLGRCITAERLSWLVSLLKYSAYRLCLCSYSVHKRYFIATKKNRIKTAPTRKSLNNFCRYHTLFFSTNGLKELPNWCLRDMMILNMRRKANRENSRGIFQTPTWSRLARSKQHCLTYDRNSTCHTLSSETLRTVYRCGGSNSVYFKKLWLHPVQSV